MATKVDKNREAYLEAYKLLVSMLQHDELLFWRRNEMFILINGGLLTLLSLAGSIKISFLGGSNFGVLVCILGFILNLLWLLIAARSESFYNLWHEQLEYLEAYHLDPINIFSISTSYFIKGSAKLGKNVLKLGRIVGLIRIFQAVRLSIFFFIVVWLVVLVGLITFA